MALTGDEGRKMSRALIDSYFRTVTYPYTRHHIDSFDQFMQKDLISIIKTQNPILILKDLIDEHTNTYRYKVEVFIGGETGEEIEIGAPTINLQRTEETRLLFPNEARLRNMTYASSVYANITVKIQYTDFITNEQGNTVKVTENLDIPKNTFDKYELFKIPIMLHSRYCVLNNKPRDFLTQAGECHYDNGGYFIVDGAEKVLITRQEQAFNTLYVTPQPSDPKLHIYASISCLSAKTRMVKRVAFFLTRDRNTIQVQLPFVRRPIPLFVLFRALGFQSDEEIIKIIFPDFDAPDAKLLIDKLQPSIIEAYPFLNSHTAIQFIKTLTKGFSAVHVLDIIRNQTFIHMPNDSMTQAIFLGDCVRKILRVQEGYDSPTDRDDTRNQRCLVSGFLVQMLFSGVYNKWRKSVALAIDEEYNYNKGTLYKGKNFKNIFEPGNVTRIFRSGQMTDGIMRGFRGKWGSGMGEEKTGVLQALSRLSYCDFMSHCRRVILDFDTGMKLTGPRKLHTSQYGYFCTSETPTGASIGITKNLTIMAAISTATNSIDFLDWLRKRGNVYHASDLTLDQRVSFVPVYVNGGMFGYTARASLLTKVCKLLKRTGCLPYSASVTFSIRDRRVYIYLDEGRPMRPLIWLEDTSSRLNIAKLSGFKKWRDLVMGNLAAVATKELDNTDFTDPQKDIENPKLESYITLLEPHTGVIEYIDPYEQNEAYIANYPDHIKDETTHVEVHPSTILSLMTSQIPFPQHNQSPRNQLSCSQSKQGVSYYATNWQNRFDNTAHVLCYGEAPLTRSMYTNYLGEGKMPYGMNCILAIACWSGYNQEDGIVMNQDALQRGMFRTMGYRSYEAFEEDDEMTKTRTRFGNPIKIAAWKDLKPGLDYTKLDENGFIKEGEYVDENTVIVGAYMIGMTGQISDASVTPQVWTKGRVEKIAITVGNNGLRLIKIRVVQDRIPELGDKFCLTPDHEVLTKDGWKGIADINLDDKVCALNEDHTISFVNPINTYKFDCVNEDLYNIKSQQVDLCVTNNHKMYVKPRNSITYKLIEAKDIYGKRVSYKKNGINTNIDYQFILPAYRTHSEVKVNMNSWLEFLGYWISDGWVTKTERHDRDLYEYRVEISQVKREDRERLIELIKELGYHPTLDKSNEKIFISNIQLATYLYQFSNGASNKCLPSWVWQLSTEQSRILIKGLIQGDGTTTNSGSQKLFTCSKKLADEFQRLCLQAGWSANIVKRMEAGTEITIKGKATKANYDQYSIAIVKSKNEPTINHGHTKTQNGQAEYYESYTGGVYCIEVPSHIFYVRRNGKPVWTGNSNRHGQKGTIGAMLRGHDMPRTKDGIVPDMIMNPHAIPSRMTIAQNLEQLFGKVAGLTGTIGEATAFMNDGSPEDQIGALLEAVGYERYGNEILYNGATGEQIPAYIFIGPVYGMRLKHMVEDKWQARGKGRKEQRTHQPTGGRGQQGGLKIGEMDRDAIAGHSISSFFKESFMERSDGTNMALCVGCGLQPIYNPKLGIAICPMCDGPVRYAGESAGTLEILPPLGRPKSKIVEVEMPYATKVLGQELETYLNIGMRFITTADIQRFEQLELTGTEVSEMKELMPLIMPNPIVAEKIEPIKETEITLEQLAAMGADLRTVLQAAPPQMDYLQEEAAVGEMQPEDFMPENVVMMPEGAVSGFPVQGAATLHAEANPIPGVAAFASAQETIPEAFAPTQPTEAAVVMPGALPGKGSPRIISVNTSPEAMIAEGLGAPSTTMGGARRQFRRTPGYGGYAPTQGFGGSGAPINMVPGRSETTETGEVIKLNASAPVVVQKLG